MPLFEVTRGRLCGAPAAAGERLTGLGLLGAWHSFTGPDHPCLVAIHGWDSFAQRDTAIAQERHASALLRRAPALLLRHNTGIYAPAAAWSIARQEDDHPPRAIYEWRVQQILNGHQAEAARIQGESTLPLLQAFGARVVCVLDLLLGSPRPHLATLLAWPDVETHHRAWSRIHVDPRYWRRRDEERTRFRRRLFGDEQAWLMCSLPGVVCQENLGLPK